jgi:alkylation response protein AidB-like acyl-CoA dehydrogenase
MNPLDQIELMEILAYADPSVAWCVSILSDSGFYAGFLEEPAAQKLFPDLDARCAGMLAPVGQAEIVPGGYRVTGHWAFGSGSLHATHLTGGCLVMQDGKPIIEENGLPRWRVMIFDPADVEIEDTWYTTGLRGSGSNDYSIKNAFVPNEHRSGSASRSPDKARSASSTSLVGSSEVLRSIRRARSNDNSET